MTARQPKKIPKVAEVVRSLLRGGKLRLSKHASKRMEERGILQPEILDVLRNGRREAAKDELKGDRWTYAFKHHVTSTERQIRVVVGVDEDHQLVLVVTTIVILRD